MLDKLRTELALPAYDGLTDQQAADALNAATIEHQQEYMLTDIRLAALIGTAKTVTVIEAFKAQDTALALWIVEKLATTGLDVGNSEAPSLIEPLVSGGVVTQEDADLILALGQSTTTRAKQIGINRVIPATWVQEARL